MFLQPEWYMGSPFPETFTDTYGKVVDSDARTDADEWLFFNDLQWLLKYYI